MDDVTLSVRLEAIENRLNALEAMNPIDLNKQVDVLRNEVRGTVSTSSKGTVPLAPSVTVMEKAKVDAMNTTIATQAARITSLENKISEINNTLLSVDLSKIARK